MKKRVIATIVVAVIAFSGITVAFAASGKQGYISPKAILPGAITSEHIKDEDITADDIGDNAVDSAEIADDAVDSAEIADDAVDSAEIADDVVDSAEIADDAVDSAEIKNSAVHYEDMYYDAIGIAEMRPNAIEHVAMRDDAVNSTEIINESIDDEDLGDKAIPSVVKCRTGKKTGLDNVWEEDFNLSISTERRMAFIFTYAANLTNTTSENALLARASVGGNIADPSPVRVADYSTTNVQRTVTFINPNVVAGDYYVNASVRTAKADNTYSNITDRVFTVIALPTAAA